jgi:dCMP deaminase
MSSDLHFLRVAAGTAKSASQDPRTQNGAILVARRGTVVAANAYPIRRWASGERLEPPAKYRYIEHAERGVIYEAGRCGLRTDGATLYVVWFACPDCARAIICSGIKGVVGSLHARQATPARWLEAVEDGERMLREAGVNTRWIADKLDVTITFDGRDLHL